MPYKLSKNGLCVEDANGKKMKCYKTHKQALAYLGALEANVPDAGGKSMELIEKIKSGMTVKEYAGQEGWDINQAAQALQLIAGLMSSEADEPQDVELLKTIIRDIQKFIDAEIEEAQGMEPMEGDANIGTSTTGDSNTSNIMSLKEEMVYFGDTIKSLGDNKFGGYLIRFSTRSDPDLTNEYFDAKSDIHIPSDIPILYNHGKDKHFKKSIIGKVISIKMDAVGAWLKEQLYARDEYEKAVVEMAKAGKLGFSSGALSYLVEREPAGKAMYIKTWFVGEASNTVRPAEFRNGLVALKSLITDEAALPDKSAIDNYKELKTMDEKEIDALVTKRLADAEAERLAKAQAETAKQAELQAAEVAGYKKAVEDLKGGKAPAFNIIDTGTSDESNGGVAAFKHWVATGQENKELIRPGSSEDKWGWGDAKAAFNVTTGASGSFLVPDLLYSQIQQKFQLASWVRSAPVQAFQTPADHLLVPVEDTKFTAFTLTAEAAAYTEDEATLNQKDLILYKYTKLVKMSEEFVNYQQTNFDAWLVNALARAVAITENTIYTTGAGGTSPEGVSTNPTAGNTVATTLVIAPADLTGLVGQLGAGYNVPGQTGFLMSNATRWYLKGLSSTNYFAFVNTPNQGPQGGAQSVGPVGDPGFFGYPAYISDDMGTYASQTAKAVLFGNYNFYGIVERPGMMLQRNPYLYMANGQIGLFASMYRGGGVLQSEAFYYLVPK